jgi:single-strand DNA-binding protein
MNDLRNSCKFTGRLGHDPELQYLPTGTAKAKTSMAVNRVRKVGDKYENDTTWVDLVIFGPRAENFVRFAKKGSLVAVDCEYQKDHWTTEDGQNRVSHNFVIRQFDVLANGRTKDEVEEEDNYGDDDFGLGSDDDGDIFPF